MQPIKKLYYGTLEGAKAYNNLGRVWLEQGQTEQAIAYLEKAIRLDPIDGEAYQNLCYALHRQKKLVAAIKKCEQALSLDPSKTEVKLYLEEAQRLWALLRYPQVFQRPERLPSSEIEPLVSLKRSVVKIIVKGSNGMRVGTGWVFSREGTKGWIITNRHVVKEKNNSQTPAKIEVEFYSQPPPGGFRKRQPAIIVQTTSNSDWLDLALLKVPRLPKDIQPLPISQHPVEPNIPIRVLGHPNDGEDWTISTGQISQKTARGMQLTADLAMGNSGSPVFNEQNQVVGVAVAVTMFCREKTGLEAVGINWDFNCGLALPIESVVKQLTTWLAL
ncbi:MAG: trypsin-like peptidase domain-containing protein [Xenococcaceae cyanobacterium MO_207.B15]|nr:trypsin-like peptidase domain-containing protein [Xenococcaceae cyanobacterium MO_207.B15]